MALEKHINARIPQKIDSELNWDKAINFIPMKGEIIVYSKDENYSYDRIKIGDGIKKVKELPFINLQSNWNQNDETKNDYIKNKPFGTVFEGQQIIQTASGFPGAATISISKNLNPGYYQIDFKGATYEFVIESDTTQVGVKENFPFTLNRQRMGQDVYVWTFKCSDTSSTNNSFTLYENDYTIVTIDDKFIPSTIARTENLVGQKTTEGGEIFNDYENNTASGKSSHAEGYDTTASNDYAHAEGVNSVASGFASHAEGSDAKAIGVTAHAEGYYSEASGDAAHAEGYQTKASGDAAHSEGYEAKATGLYAHAEGRETLASNETAHAEGIGTIASGFGSHAEGVGTIAAGAGQHVEGEFNLEDQETYLHITGNGISGSSRSNAHTIDRHGDGWFSGDVYVGSTSGTNRDDGSKKLATEEYVNNVASIEEATDEEILEILLSMGIAPVLTDSNGALYTDENDNVLLV